MLVYDVTSVDVTLDKSKPPFVKVKAKGTVRSGGYTNPRLEMVYYPTPPADGIQDLSFEADPPKGPATDDTPEIESRELDMGQVPDWMRGVRVRAETNKMEKRF